MIEIREVLRLWLSGRGKKPIARQLGLDPKTVRRYTRAAEARGLRREDGPDALTEERLVAVVAMLDSPPERERGPSWSLCLEQQKRIENGLAAGLRLTKVRKLLTREGIQIPYPTLHRFAVAELGFGQRATTIAVLDGEPGDELQLDTGWVGWLAPDLAGRRRRFRAWILTAARSPGLSPNPCRMHKEVARLLEMAGTSFGRLDGGPANKTAAIRACLAGPYGLLVGERRQRAVLLEVTLESPEVLVSHSERDVCNAIVAGAYHQRCTLDSHGPTPVPETDAGLAMKEAGKVGPAHPRDPRSILQRQVFVQVLRDVGLDLAESRVVFECRLVDAGRHRRSSNYGWRRHRIGEPPI